MALIRALAKVDVLGEEKLVGERRTRTLPPAMRESGLA